MDLARGGEALGDVVGRDLRAETRLVLRAPQPRALDAVALEQAARKDHLAYGDLAAEVGAQPAEGQVAALGQWRQDHLALQQRGERRHHRRDDEMTSRGFVEKLVGAGA